MAVIYGLGADRLRDCRGDAIERVESLISIGGLQLRGIEYFLSFNGFLAVEQIFLEVDAGRSS